MGKSVTFFESAAIKTAAVVCSSRTHQNMDALDIVSRILNTESEMENFLATYKLCKPGKAFLSANFFFGLFIKIDKEPLKRGDSFLRKDHLGVRIPKVEAGRLPISYSCANGARNAAAICLALLDGNKSKSDAGYLSLSSNFFGHF